MVPPRLGHGGGNDVSRAQFRCDACCAVEERNYDSGDMKLMEDSLRERTGETR